MVKKVSRTVHAFVVEGSFAGLCSVRLRYRLLICNMLMRVQKMVASTSHEFESELPILGDAQRAAQSSKCSLLALYIEKCDGSSSARSHPSFVDSSVVSLSFPSFIHVPFLSFFHSHNNLDTSKPKLSQVHYCGASLIFLPSSEYPFLTEGLDFVSHAMNLTL